MLLPSVARGERALTLDDALALARARNRDLRIARAQLDQSAVAIEQARAALLPQVTAQGKYTHNYKEVDVNFGAFSQPILGLAEVIKKTSGNPIQNGAINSFEQQLASMAPSPSTIVIQKLDQLDFSLNASVPLIVPYAYSALGAARRTVAANQANYAATEATLLYQVAQSFFAAAGADQLLVARQHAIEVAKQTFDNATTRFNAGVVNRVEVTRAEVALVQAEQAAEQAADTQSQLYRALATLLGLHDDFRVVTSEPPAAAPPPVDELVGRALSLRPEFHVYEKQADAARANVNANWLKWLPSLSAFGSLRAYNYAGFSGDFYAWAVGAQLDWTFYDGGLRDAARHQAAAQRREAEARLELLHDTIADDVVNARRALLTKRKALEAAERSFSLSTDTLRLVRAQYDAGTARQLDLLTAQDQLVAAEVQVAQARFDLALAQLLVERTSGTFPERSTR